ncbi:MAG: hypothetical protein H6668_08110 [Ardenticatenaceae bacterium]|nr:hypothetical protein [Ardenticatenaceae bacterium]
MGKQLWGLRGLTAVYLLSTLVWIPLEGNLHRAVGMGVATTAVLLAHGWHRYGAGRALSLGWWLGKTAVVGLLFGAGSSLLTLLAMAVKTGLHAHGPEFTPAEIIWVWQQLPLWAVAGLLAGLGVGLVIGNQ